MITSPLETTTDMKFDANATIKKAEEDYGLGKGEYFKPQEGDNRIRMLSPFVLHQGEYNGKPTYKFVAWILDRKDQKVKSYFMPKTIADEIGALQSNPEYAFDETPMTYDITINAKGAGTIDVEYKVIAARSNMALTDEELKAFGEKPSIEEFLKKVSDKKGQQADQETTQASGTETKAEDIPF